MAQGRLRERLSRWANVAEQESQDLLRQHREVSSFSIADAPDRERISVRGTLRTVTLRPRGGVPALEAELYDGSGTLTLIWLGRRRITGIQPGRDLAVRGLIGLQGGNRVMFNPRYELIP